MNSQFLDITENIITNMQGNPFAWIIFALTMGLLFANVTLKL